MLRAAGSNNCVARSSEREEEGVTLRVDLDAAFGGARLPNDAPVLGQVLRVHLGAERMQESRRSLDVCEEERHGALREVVSHSAIIRPPRPRVQSYALEQDRLPSRALLSPEASETCRDASVRSETRGSVKSAYSLRNEARARVSLSAMGRASVSR